MKKILAVTLVICVFSMNMCKGQAIATVALAGVGIKSLIDQFESTATRLMQQAQTTGNGIASKFGNEIHVATQNLNLYLQGNINKTFNELSIQEQNIFVQLNEMIKAFNTVSSSLVSVSELTNLDLVDFTNRILIFGKQVDYLISSINGTTIVNTDADYVLQVAGIGFGMNDSRKSYNTRIYVNNILMSAVSVDFTKRKIMTIVIPNKIIKPLLNDDSIKFIPIRIIAEVTKKSALFGIPKRKEYKTDFNLVAMPTIAGEVTYKETITVQMLGDAVAKTSISRSFQDCKSDHPCEMIEELRVADNQKITLVTYECNGQCGWAYKKRSTTPGNEYAADFDILEDGRKVVVYRHLDGQNPTTITYYIYYKTLKNDYKEIDHPQKIKLRYGQPFDLVLNGQNENCNYSVVGKLKTGQIVNCNNNIMGSSPYLKLLGVGKNGGICVATFQLTPP